MAVMRPSLVTPVLSVITEAGAGRVALRTSSLVMTIFTGLPVFSARRAHRGESCWCSFPPKEPPTSTGITLILLRGRPRNFATNSLTLKMP